VSFQVRPCGDLEQFTEAVFAIGQYFNLQPTEESMQRFTTTLPIERMHAAWEGKTIVGGAGAFPFELTVPGAIVPTAGVTVVGTYPTHRRRGVLRAMMRAQLDDFHERGEPLAALWASDDMIYGRFGFGMASHVGSVSIPREQSQFAQPLERESTLRIVDRDNALQVFPKVWDRVRPQLPGMLARTRSWWENRILRDQDGESPKRRVLLEHGGRPAGYAIYRHKPKWEDGVSLSELEVVEAIALDGRPTAELWRYLLDVDWAAATTARLLPLDHVLFWLLAHPRRMRFRVADGLWARLVDVGAALSARRYATDGAVVLDVSDAFCPWNAGRWRLADGVAKRSRAAAHIRLDVGALASVYLGWFRFEQLVRAGRVEELRRGAARRADAIFSWHRAPWCPEIF
jgi:predicted acetyltransferase